MILTIMQPGYIPWLGFFDRVMSSDLLILLDHVQIESGGSFTNRNRIRTATGNQWLTIPIRNSGSASREINRVQIVNDSPWQKKHWSSIVNNYSKTPYFSAYAEKFHTYYYKEEFVHLADALLANYLMVSDCLNATKTFVRSSEMDVHSSKGDLIVDLCQKVSATKYISGPFGRNYLNPIAFEKAGIDLVFHDYQHPIYTQIHGGFMPYLSAIDVLFNHGPDALSIITNGRCTASHGKRFGQ